MRTSININKMIRANISLKTIIGQRVTVTTSRGRETGTIIGIVYNMYPLVELADGKHFRAGDVLKLAA